MKRRGFTILELLAAIGLMAVMGLISQRLFVSSFRTMRTAREADTAITRFDHAMLRLRADAWSSSSISADGLSATLQQPGGAAIHWQFNSTGMLTRRDGQSEINWPDISTHARFSADGPALLLTLPEGFTGQSSQIKLISQLQLSREGTP